MMKHQVVAMKLHDGKIEYPGGCGKMTLPKGCVGLLFVFESKKAAREFWGNNAELLRVEIKPNS
jgi:hypothetical protein